MSLQEPIFGVTPAIEMMHASYVAPILVLHDALVLVPTFWFRVLGKRYT